uniref:Uncharacterized protein n=1 Tax=Rhizophora mucronata TaxID=61149 RepID=A0A2P2LTN2_RHIMU
MQDTKASHPPKPISLLVYLSLSL